MSTLLSGNVKTRTFLSIKCIYQFSIKGLYSGYDSERICFRQSDESKSFGSLRED